MMVYVKLGRNCEKDVHKLLGKKFLVADVTDCMNNIFLVILYHYVFRLPSS